jgi:hypothetical protein
VISKHNGCARSDKLDACPRTIKHRREKRLGCFLFVNPSAWAGDEKGLLVKSVVGHPYSRRLFWTLKPLDMMGAYVPPT